jgi:hypothetical protein
MREIISTDCEFDEHLPLREEAYYAKRDDIMVPMSTEARQLHDFKYLIGTLHLDDENGLLYRCTRVVVRKGVIIAYRALELANGRTQEDKIPIHIADIVRMTQDTLTGIESGVPSPSVSHIVSETNLREARKAIESFYSPPIACANSSLNDYTSSTTDHRKSSDSSKEEDEIRVTWGQYFQIQGPPLFDADAIATHVSDPTAGSYANKAGTRSDSLFSPAFSSPINPFIEDFIDENSVGNSLSNEERKIAMHISFIPRTNPANRTEMLASEYRDAFLAAEATELTSIATNETLSELVPIPAGARVIGNRMVYKWKYPLAPRSDEVSTAPLKRAKYNESSDSEDEDRYRSAYLECDADESLQPFAEFHVNHEPLHSAEEFGTDTLPNDSTTILPEPKAKARLTVKDFKNSGNNVGEVFAPTGKGVVF